MNSDQVLDVLEEIAATSSRTEKEAIVERHIGDPLFKRVLQYATDPMITFGLTPEKPKKEGGWAVFHTGDLGLWEFLEDLRHRRLTGNAAKDALAKERADLTAKSDELLWRILSKDLRAGMTANTVNRVLPGTVPVFKVMLAHPYEQKRVTKFPVAVEPKLDGLRVIGLVRGPEAKFFSRTGKHFPALDHLGPAVASMVELAAAYARSFYVGYAGMFGDKKNATLAIDAEVVSGSFNKTTGDVRRKSETADDAVLHIFDVAPYEFFTSDDKVFDDWVFQQRRGFVEFLISHAECGGRGVIRHTPLKFAHSADEIAEIYDEHRAAGLEGAMVKPLDGLYSKSRSFAWMKLKPQETEDLRVIGAFEGTGKYEGALGGLIVDRAGVEVRVGGGFSDDQRAEIWRELQSNDIPHLFAASIPMRPPRDKKPGFVVDDIESVIVPLRILRRLIEVEYHEVTPDGSLRHPRFVGWRDDKDDQALAA